MRRLLRILREGLNSLSIHRMRALFMMAGTILGIASLTVVMAMNDGARQELEKNLAQFGTDVIRVRAGGGRSRGMGMRQPTMRLEDARAIVADVPGIKTIVPTLHVEGATLRHKEQNRSSFVIGVTEDFVEMPVNKIATGRGFNRQDIENSARVCVVGPTVVNELFGGQKPLGKRLMLNKVSFTVVGVLVAQGARPDGMDFDDRVFIPLTTAMKRVVRTDFISGINVISESAELVPQQAAAMKELLRQRHKLGPGEEDDFMLITAEAMEAFHLATVNQLSLLLGALALLCLIVGGVVLMNIMLVSVGERTKEVGLRRAMGASSRDIFAQFLTESVVVNFLGMLAGTALGAAVFVLLGALVKDMPMAFSWRGLGIGVAFSVLVGVGFGTLPARRASLMSPVEALR